MPWHIARDIEDCSGYAVVKDDDGDLEGCHETRADAEAQVAALYASESDKGNALKAVARTDDELRVANYMVLFGGRDLEGVASKRRNRDGSAGEFFTKATIFDSAYTDTGRLYVDWEHGIGLPGEPSADDVLGYVDWKSARVDDRGLFVERVLNRRNRYVQWLEELIDGGLLGNSTEAISDQVEKGDDGEIKRWPLRRDTLTVTPMEPRMLQENQVRALKALAERWPNLANIVNIASDDGEQPGDSKATEPEAESATAEPAASQPDARTAPDVERLLLELDLLEVELP